jgi:hypothetical protein
MSRRNYDFGEDLRRISFVRLIAQWLGKPAAIDLQEAFGLSRAQAYRVLKDAEEVSGGGTPMGEASAVIDFLRAQHLCDRLRAGLGLNSRINIEDIDASLLPPLPGSTVEVILRAMRSKKTIVMAYAGRKGASDRLISPVRLVLVLNRYHVRAWDHAKLGYRDFVLSRIVEVRMSSEPYSAPYDKELGEKLRLDFRINPELPMSLRTALAAEWDLHDEDIRAISCSKAHARYIVRRLTETTAGGRRRWLPANEAASAIFNSIERDVNQDENS